MTTWLRRLFLCIYFTSQFFSIEGNYRIDSAFTGYDGEKKTYLLTLFLPYNPRIVSYSRDPKVKTICNNWWPKGDFFLDSEYTANACDLIWIDSAGDELNIPFRAADRVKQASAIFTTTHFQNYSGDFYHLKSFLEAIGFTLMGHWYWENLEGQAMFIRNDLFAAAMNTLNYSPSNSSVASIASENNLQKLLRKIDDKKSNEHKIDEIDFIYMINLDERPEKFALASNELAKFGISPYRFSAVNGWKLSTQEINQVGVKFSSNFEQKFLGSIYREIDNHEYLGNEILRPNGETFFTLGMSHGAIGIVLSHLSILQDAYDSGYQTIWIMEDDVEVVSDARLISELIPKLDGLVNDWDILFTDTDTKDRNGNHVPCRAVAARPNVAIEPLASFFQKFYPISPEFSRIGMRYGAYSMIIRRSGMEKILNYFKKYGIFIPYDMDIWLNPDLKIYSVNQDLVSHRAGAPTDNSEPNYLKEKN